MNKKWKFGKRTMSGAAAVVLGGLVFGTLRLASPEAKLKLADAEQKVKETEAKLSADRSAASADLATKKQKHDQAAFQVQQDEHSVALLTLRAPLDGVVSLQNHWQPQGGPTPFKPGDRAWPG